VALSTRNLPGVKIWWTALYADDFTAICETIV
jgi:hypothetical protein